jgi:hypothetical protein
MSYDAARTMGVRMIKIIFLVSVVGVVLLFSTRAAKAPVQ